MKRSLERHRRRRVNIKERRINIKTDLKDGIRGSGLDSYSSEYRPMAGSSEYRNGSSKFDYGNKFNQLNCIASFGKPCME
jgi:hypothetical protein